MTAGGKAVYELWRAAVPDVVCNVPGGPWEDLPVTVQAGFDAVAAGPRWTERLGPVVACDHGPDADPETLAAARQEAGVLNDRLAALRELLDEVGVLAANAPEDGDGAFTACEEIAMRIAAADVPEAPAKPSLDTLRRLLNETRADLAAVLGKFRHTAGGNWTALVTGEEYDGYRLRARMEVPDGPAPSRPL